MHIIGFAKAVGDIAKGAAGVLRVLRRRVRHHRLLLFWYSGSLMITSLALICAIVPVIWLLGLLPIFGLGLDPMSILVPFLIFSIARVARGADDQRLEARDAARRGRRRPRPRIRSRSCSFRARWRCSRTPSASW